MSSLPVLIFDFDGTVSLGDGPVLAYAHAIGVALGDSAGAKLVATVVPQLEVGLEGYIDGYDLVRHVALQHGATEEQLSAAYLASREQLGKPGAAVIAPVGLADFLRAARAERILLTNAPAIRLEEALEALGLSGLFDRVISNAAKPAGLEVLLDTIAAHRPVLSIGDVWGNDLAPAAARGHATAYVGAKAVTPWACAEGSAATYRGATVTEILPQLAAWLEAASSAP